MVKTLLFLFILLLIFLFYGSEISFLQPYHQRFYIRYYILKADFLMSLTLYVEALEAYCSIYDKYQLDNEQLYELKEKINKAREAIKKSDLLLRGVWQRNAPPDLRKRL